MCGGGGCGGVTTVREPPTPVSSPPSRASALVPATARKMAEMSAQPSAAALEWGMATESRMRTVVREFEGDEVVSQLRPEP